MKIIPALLVKTPEELESQIEKLSSYFQHFQIDIADGKFVPEKTITLEEIANIASLRTQPLLSFDFDLLVSDITAALNGIDKISQQIKVDMIFIHNLDSFNPKPNAGIAIDPPISVDTIKQEFDLNSIPVIQIMSVIPGAQGRAFIPETLYKIEQLRNAGYRNKIYLDGAINNQTIPLIMEKQFRPDILCIGSYLTQAKNIEERAKILGKI